METEKFKVSDILYGFGIPMILALIIFVLTVYVNPGGEHHVLGVDGIGGTIAIILTQGFGKMIILGIPLILGLVWNKWAGGAAGFIMGGMYYILNAGYGTAAYVAYGQNWNFYGDVSMIFYLVNAVIIGYMAGALTNGSTNFFRMIGAGLTAALSTAVLQEYINYNFALEPGKAMCRAGWTDDPLMAFTLAFIPMILLGVIIPILAKVMSWYGLTARKQY